MFFLIHLWNVHFYKLHHSFGQMCVYITIMLLKDIAGIRIVICKRLSSVSSTEYHHQGRHMSLLFAWAVDVVTTFVDVDGLFERSSTTTAR